MCLVSNPFANSLQVPPTEFSKGLTIHFPVSCAFPFFAQCWAGEAAVLENLIGSFGLL